MSARLSRTPENQMGTLSRKTLGGRPQGKRSLKGVLRQPLNEAPPPKARGGCVPPSRAHFPTQKGHRTAVIPIVEREEVAPPPAPYFFGKGYTVENERALRLARMFRAIDKSRPEWQADDA